MLSSYDVDSLFKVYADLKNPLIIKLSPFFTEKGLLVDSNQMDLVFYYLLLRKMCLSRQRQIDQSDFNKWLVKRFPISNIIGSLDLKKIDNIESCHEEIEEAISALAQTRLLRSFGGHQGVVQRKSHGVFYTPYAVAKIIAEEALSSYRREFLACLDSRKKLTNIKQLYKKFIQLQVLDPACGSGIILSAMVDVLAAFNDFLGEHLADESWYLDSEKFRNLVISQNIHGVDIDKYSCFIAESVLICKFCSSPVLLKDAFVVADTLKPSGGLFSDDKDSVEMLLGGVLSQGGFDIVVMNPPYERLKVDISSYKELPNGAVLYREEKKEIERQVALYKESRQYPLTAKGVLDLYKLFIEKAFNLASPLGSISFIVPFSLLGDVSCSALRKHIFRNTVVGNVYCLPENAKIFNKVSQAFCIMGLSKQGKADFFNVFLDVSSVKPLSYRAQVCVNSRDIDVVAPESFSIPLCDKKAWRILKKMHNHPTIKNIPEISNLRGEFDLTIGKDFIHSRKSSDILIRGNHIKSYSLDLDKGVLEYVDREKLVKEKILGAKLQYLDKPRLVGQQISNMGLKKRLKFSIVSSGVLANSCNFIFINDSRAYNIYYLLGILNSFLLNWRFKLTSTNNHVNNYELDELPIPLRNVRNSQIISDIARLAKCQAEEYMEDTQAEIDKLVFSLYGLSESEIVHIGRNNYYEKSLKNERVVLQYA